MNRRIRLYLNSGLVYFVATMLFSGDDELIPVFSLIFNIVISRSFRHHYFGYQLHYYERLLISCVSFVTITFIFILQYQHQDYVDGGCIRTISEVQAGVSYLCYQIIFTMMIWEAGRYIFQSKRVEIIDDSSFSR